VRRPGLRVVCRVLLAVLLAGTVAGAWVRALRPGDRVTGASTNVERVDWVGTLAPDGTLAVRTEIALRPGAAGALGEDVEFILDLPRGTARLRVDGRPARQPAAGRTGPLAADGTLSLAYEVRGAARRTDGGVLLTTVVVPAFGQFVDDYGDAEVRATLVVASGATVGGTSRLPGARAVRDDHEGAVLAVAGAASTYDPVHLVASLPAAAAPDAPVSEDAAGGSPDPRLVGGLRGGGQPVPPEVAEALAAGDMEAVADGLAEGRVPDGRPVSPGPVPTLVAVLLTVELAGLAAWSAWRSRRARRRAAHRAAEARAAPAGAGPAMAGPAVAAGSASAAAGPDRELAEPGPGLAGPPEDVAPDVVAMLVASDGATVATREAVAADLLRMVDRRELAIESLDSRRFVLRVPPGDIGSNPAERAIVRALRPQGQAAMATQLVGPPLWASGRHPFLGTVEADVRRRARRAGYLARTLRMGVFVPLVLLLPLTALVGSGEDDRVVVVAALAFVAALVLAAVVSVTSPLSLTPAGEEVRRRARAFARTVAETEVAAELGAPAILVRGPYLVYAVATGVAPRAAEDVGTGRTLVSTALFTPAGAGGPAS
jgi:hypothetical protein